MRINCHGHVFNFRSLNTAHTRQTLVNRLTNEKWPDFLVKVISKVFDELLKDENIDEEQLLRTLLKELKASKEFKGFIEDVFSSMPGDIGIIIHGNLDALSVEVMRNLIRKLSDRLSNNDDIRNQDIEDILGFLLIGMQPSISDVAEHYMEHSAGRPGSDSSLPWYRT